MELNARDSPFPTSSHPYYEDEWVTLYLGDCRDFLPAIAADVLVTDPPYGVDLGTGDRDPRGALCDTDERRTE